MVAMIDTVAPGGGTSLRSGYKLSRNESNMDVYTYVVDPPGIAPGTRPCHGRVLLLYHGPFCPYFIDFRGAVE